MDSPRYTEAQLGALIQRATELHEASGGAEHALTLADAERVAIELGIPAAHVRVAALELEASAKPRHGLLGAPFSVGVAKALPRSMDEAQWDRVVMALRRETGTTGRLGGIGREWSHGIEDGGVVLFKTHAFLHEDRDGATLDLRAQYGGAAFFSYLLAFAGGATLTAIGIDGSGLPDALGPPALIGLTASGGVGGMTLVRAGLAVWADRQRDRLARLAGVVQRAVGTYEPERVPDEPVMSPVLDLDALPDVPESETAASRVRVR